MFGLLVADLGHLYSVKSLGLGIYFRAWGWNAMHWGNVGFVYIGASKFVFQISSTAFYLDVGDMYFPDVSLDRL